ncbi:hypothetical protein KDX38_10905 [Pseudomonas sp. CDFA 602]|uniref:hypothetical protein n=1 Tax=Pseudomonas californiensis TaxID=2829823 RepID=UPI001E617C70|nr:hypothetical protein [Pseudomonas californiensis]MCD5994174.1 hypothetical protein [Pseudomonas californiensis]MCD5999727.1 hypothetical protein [Pseudomonas californiensis]
MSNDKMRTGFEDWIKGQEDYFGDATKSLSRCDEDPDEYLCGAVHGAWMAWQASREALVIDLPKPFAVIGDYAACGGGRAVWDIEHAEKIHDRMCEKTAVYDRAGLEAAGVKVKP